MNPVKNRGVANNSIQYPSAFVKMVKIKIADAYDTTAILLVFHAEILVAVKFIFLPNV